ncbi:MAG: hypothetical protein CFE25_00460 [Chitinophagaceae bacterium BSSC1]|nr:MAG: hypothetical protein CFE25_00460 [Chitinophagaceae bacterium BSSC1]
MEQASAQLKTSLITHLQKQQGGFGKDSTSLQLIIDLLPIGLILQGKQSEILSYNQMALDLLGLTKEQLMGRTSFDKEWRCIHLDGSAYPGESHPVPMAIKCKQPILDQVMGVYRPTEKEFVWLDVNAVPVLTELGELDFVICTFSNITKKIHLQKSQNETEQNLQQIFEFYPVPILLVDNETNRIHLANKKLSELMQYSKDELIGKETVDFYENIQDRNDIVDIYKQEGRINNREVRFLKKSGEAIDVLLSSELISLNGRLMKLSGFIDISRRKKVEYSLNKSLQLVSDQNTRLLNFSYIVSHNLRSHAGNIKSIVRFLGLSKTEEEKKLLMDNLRIVSENFETTMMHLNEIVQINSNVNIYLENLNLFEYATKATEMLEEMIANKAAIVLNRIPDNFVIKYNPAYLESILFNFISNALKYSSPERIPEIHLDAFWEQDRPVLVCKDNGLGIDLERNGAKLFGMYKTFHGNKDAKGIGLFMTKNQVEAMHGKIEVESEPGKGSSFKIYLG